MLIIQVRYAKRFRFPVFVHFKNPRPTQITTILTTCCYCFKRKYTDVLPPYEPFSAKEFEKYRFGVPGHTAPMKVMVPEAQEVKLDDAGQAVVAAGAAEAQPAPGGDVQAGAGTGLSPSKSPVKSP